MRLPFVFCCLQLATGFYDVVTTKEAERWEQQQESREKFRLELAQQLQQKGLDVPPALKQDRTP
jgi:hypothetical protein